MEQPPPMPGTPAPAVLKEPTMSLLARLLNVFAIPGHVFEEVKATRRLTANWLVPVLVASVVGALAAIVVYSQPVFLDQFRDQQKQLIEQRVKDKDMTREDADRMESIEEKILQPTPMEILGGVGAVMKNFASIFGWALVLWLLGRRFLKVRFDYLKALEVTGLATMISVLGMIVKLLLIINLGKMFSTQKLGLALSDFDPNNPNYPLLIAINAFQFWFIGLLAVGLGRLAGVPYHRAMFLLLGFWMILVTFLVMVGLGATVL